MAGIAASQLRQPTSNSTLASEASNCCAGCQQPIRDKFIFSVLDLYWHQNCIQCSECASKLDDRCYTFEGKLYCKLDYWRRFGPKCFACQGSIDRSELVQRIKGNQVYHLKCFTCTVCRKQLKAGEMFHLLEGSRLLCKEDYSLHSVSSSGDKSSHSDVTGTSMQSARAIGQDRSNDPSVSPFEHKEIFHTSTSSITTSEQQSGETCSKLSSDSVSGQVHNTGGLSGGEEEQMEKDADEKKEDDGVEGNEEEEGRGRGGDKLLDDIQHLLSGYHHDHQQHDTHLCPVENDENHGYHSEQQQQVEYKPRSKHLASEEVVSNAKRKRQRKRAEYTSGTNESTLDDHENVSKNRNDESILHGLAAHSKSNGSILAEQCTTASANLHKITSSTANHQHLEQHSHPQQQQRSTFSSSPSTASNSSTNSNLSPHINHGITNLTLGGGQNQTSTPLNSGNNPVLGGGQNQASTPLSSQEGADSVRLVSCDSIVSKLTPNSNTKIALTSNGTNKKQNRRRSSERKDSLREGLMRTSDFVIALKDIQYENPSLWKITNPNLLQHFEPKIQNGVVLYELTHSFGGWNPEIMKDYIGVDVKLTTHSRNHITVEKLLLNFQKLEDAESFYDKHFVIYLQILISTALDPNFWESIENEPKHHDYFYPSRRIIEDIIKRFKAKLASKLKLNECSLKNIEKYPNLIINPADLEEKEQLCRGCNKNLSTQTVTFENRSYDLHSYNPVKIASETSYDKYLINNLCDTCLEIVKLYSEIHHTGWKLFNKAKKKVELHRVKGKPINVILDECLKDDEWLDTIYSERDALWSKVEQFQ